MAIDLYAKYSVLALTLAIKEKQVGELKKSCSELGRRSTDRKI
jgi:hypothetical protein